MSIIKVNFQTGKRINDEPLESCPTQYPIPLFYHSTYKISHNCKNIHAYLCEKCGACGRKFSNDGFLEE